jgi:ketosteroid isomerase-like protein
MRIAILLLSIVLAPLAFAEDSTDLRALEAASQAWVKAFNAHDIDGLMKLATPDVALIEPSAAVPVNGPQAVRAAWESASGSIEGRVASVTREVSVAGDVAWRTAVVTNKLPNGEVAARGQSLEIWKRVNGEWRLHRQMSANILTLPRLRPGPPPSKPALDAPVQ